MQDCSETLIESKAFAHRAWWSASVGEFLAQNIEPIVERLNFRLVEAQFTARADQLPAWRQSLLILRGALRGLPEDWRLLLEYPLLRLGRRLDVVLVSDRAIFVFEFKTNKFGRAGRTQAEDYALDLRDFHAGSRHHPIVPILVATGVPKTPAWEMFVANYEHPLLEANMQTLPALLRELMQRIEHRGVHIAGWEDAAYRPVPTIIESALMLYRKHGVDEIKMARADVTNLTLTTERILAAIRDAKTDGRHIIVFITGIPGAGKTLCGLNAVFSTDVNAAFLTGTLPMVYVLRQALADDAAAGKQKSKAEAMREAKAKIQSITGFLRDHRDRPDRPAEHVIVFDEAQRAWDAVYGARKFQLANSEAAIVLDIMKRHDDYAVIIALVGTGQEINTGEAGLAEWGNALAARPEWEVRAAPNVLNATAPRQRLFKVKPKDMMIDGALHLAVAVRQIRSTAAASWVDAVLRGQADEACDIANNAGNVPFFVTRSLGAMRTALRARLGGSRRAGLVCSSGAKRLVADGIWPKFDHLDDNNVANWFLKDRFDVRGSNALEIPATEFACQGLELDYVGLCWGGDMIWGGRWITRNFVGSKWNYPKTADAMEFCRNTYRVLLTRARYETVIWVPAGEAADPTREPALLDQTAAFFLECGATMLEEQAKTLKQERELLLF